MSRYGQSTARGATRRHATVSARPAGAELRGISVQTLAKSTWRTATSVRTAVVLMLVLGALGLVGALVEQAPSGVGGDPRAHEAWLASVRPRYGGWTDLLDRAGLFSIFGSTWFQATVGALAGCILACSINRVRSLRHTAFSPPTRVTEAFFEHAPYASSAGSGLEDAVAAERVRAILRRRGFRTIVTDDREAAEGRPAGISIYADRFRFAPFGTLVAHLGLLVILGGVIAGSAWGFRNPAFVVAVGSRAAVGNGTGLSVEAVAFTDSYYLDGSPSDYATDLVVYRDDAPVASQTVRVNQPLRYGDVSFYQSFFGPAVVVRAATATGSVAFDGGVPLVWTSEDGGRSIGQFDIPDAGLTAYVAAAASGSVDPMLQAGQIQLEVYRAGDETTPVDSAVVTQGTPARVAGLDVTFVRERQYTGLIVARDPGMPLVFGGALLVVSGFCAVFLLPARRLWALVVSTPGGCRVAVGASARRDVTSVRSFSRLTAEIEAALAETPVRGR